MTAQHHTLHLTLIPGRFAILRLPPAHPVPPWLDWRAPLLSITRSEEELSVLCPQEQLPEDLPAAVPVERDFRALVVAGPLDFALTGILARLSGALAEAGVSLFAVSTFNTDWLLVREGDLAAALEALRQVARISP